MRLRIRLHLHHQVAGLLAQSVTRPRVQIEEERGERVDHERYDRESVRPRQVIEIRIHQPVPTPALPAEYRDRQEEKRAGYCVTHERDGRQDPLVMQNESQRPTCPDQGDHEEGEDGEHQGQRDERLHDHEPHRQQPLSYDVILLRKYMVTAVELLVELIEGITELLEAILPQSHVLEVAERLLIRLYPIRTYEGHHQEEERHEREPTAENGRVGRSVIILLVRRHDDLLERPT